MKWKEKWENSYKIIIRYRKGKSLQDSNGEDWRLRRGELATRRKGRVRRKRLEWRKETSFMRHHI